MKRKVEIVDSFWFEYATIIGLLTLVYVGCFAALGSFASSANANVDYANQYETLQQTIIDEYNHRLNVSQNTGKPVDVQDFENSNTRANFRKYVAGNGRQPNNKLVDQFSKLLTKTSNKLVQRLKIVNSFIAHKAKIDYSSLRANKTIYEKRIK